MPGFLVHLGAFAICPHFGLAQPTSPNPRVLVNGQPTVTIESSFLISNCLLSPNAGGPCLSAQFTSAATRIFSNGKPLLLTDSDSKCAPTGASLLILLTQLRVSGK